ncbi:MAG TPA: alanine dehydrogenase, partial [Actinomycetes bacterium]|nr:alanine dehydrogenase [Actinomycetes bacterium]
MNVGVPKEIKPGEARVALSPAGARELTSRGHRVVVEAGAGAGSRIGDDDFQAAGAEIVPTAEDVFEQAELIVKVKEPKPVETQRLGPGHVLFTFLHLAAHPEAAKGLRASGATAIAYETVQLPSGLTPLLAPMSRIAGRMAAQVGARFLEQPQGGRGVLLCGAPGVPRARATVLGAGQAGANAALGLAGLGAQVNVLDVDVDKLMRLAELGQGNITTVHASRLAVEEYVPGSDVVVGAVLTVGAATPVLVDEDLIRQMRPGAVVVDISIDQGGTFETSHETTHSEPVFVLHDVVHYAVGNIPGAVPHTSTYALTNATLPYVLALADGLPSALARRAELATGVNVAGGAYTHP